LEFLDSGNSDFQTRTVEGYKIFRLKSTDTVANNTLNITLKDISGDTLVSTSKTIRTIDSIDVEVVAKSSEIVVGGETYEFDITLKDTSGNTLTDFNSRAYLVLNPLYGKPLSSYIDIKNGVSTLRLQTKNLAGKNIKLEFQIEGVSSITKEYIDILPEDPIRVDISLSRDKIEANIEDSTTLFAVLKDRYGNEVFNDNTTEFSLEIPEDYKSIITSSNLKKTSK